ncbi:helix-turn-helix domain-containing protein [Clostridioides difficile]
MNTIDKKIGQRLKEVRTAKKLTQAQVAEAIHVSRSLIASYEKGLKPISKRTLETLYDIFGINKDWLLNGTGGKDNMFVDILEDIDADEEIKEMTRMYLKLDDEMRNVVKKFMLSSIEEADSESKKTE